MGNLRQSQTRTTQARDQSIVSGSRKPTYHPVEELQGIIGNRALGNLIKSQPDLSGQVHRSQDPLLSSVSPVSGQPIQRMPMFRGLSHELKGNWQQGNRVQAKLTIGEAGDKYELEADRVASEVVDRINTPVTSHSNQPDSIQAQGQQDELMRKPKLQLQSVEGGMAATPELESSIQQARGSGMPIALSIRKPMEQSFGADFSGVRVHNDAQSDQLNQSIQARAFTTGKDIFFRQGEYNPGSRGGQELIAHELTHVVQQTGGKIQCKSPSDSVPSSPTLQVHLEQNKTLQRKKRGNASKSTIMQRLVRNLLDVLTRCVSPADNNSLPPYKFLIQKHELPDCNLCLYFGYYHYMNGDVNKEEFIKKAIEPYVDLGMSEQEALDFFYDGNDPGLYKKFGLSEVSYDNALKGDRLIVADVNKGHFYALIKYKGIWWNYDSYFQTNPTKIGDEKAAMDYLNDKGQAVWA
ncbi:DUF4157 domain-containing protein [Moorena sp. SIO3B2]|uniref:eCIS core domain-containing protein n=1 Tax=Moorena sp. SIO3B2 TaxID=2607827 RepID=UPI00257BA91F|nr:DUF4157 domain-containing protein [Moorena sp. SIO3B2]